MQKFFSWHNNGESPEAEGVWEAALEESQQHVGHLAVQAAQHCRH